MWIDLIDTMMHIEGQGEGGGSRVLAAMWLPSWQRAAVKIGATPKLQQGFPKEFPKQFRTLLGVIDEMNNFAYSRDADRTDLLPKELAVVVFHSLRNRHFLLSSTSLHHCIGILEP
jgi:hypothetical protein